MNIVKHLSNIIESDTKYYIIPLTFIFSVFFIIPFELYYNAQIYWNWKKFVPLNFAVSGLVVYGVILGIIALLFRLKYIKAARLTSFVLFYLGILILLCDVFSPLATNLATGEKLISQEPLIYTFIELFILLILSVITLKAKLEKGSVIGVIVSVILLFVSTGYFFLVMVSSKPEIVKAEKVEINTALRGNIYHILLDEMQTDAACIYLAEGNNVNKYEGFTLYKYNIANYIYTNASFPSYMTGSYYSSGSFERWSRKTFKKQGLLKALHEKGYYVRMYGYSDYWQNPYTNEFWSLNDIYEKTTQIKNREYQDFIQIMLARVMPNFLSNESLYTGKKIGSFIFSNIISSEISRQKDIPVSYEEGKEPFCSVQSFKEMIEKEKSRPANGQYTYLHAVLPHPPFVYNEKGEYNLKFRNKGLTGYYQQVKYAFKLVEDFIDELKRLNRYKDATIIIHSDTGCGAYGFLEKKSEEIVGTLNQSNNYADAQRVITFISNKEKLPKNLPKNILFGFKDNRLSRIYSLLMIKTPNSNNKLKISEKKTQLVDIYPSLADLLNLDTIKAEKVDGRSVFSSNFPQKREVFNFWFPQKDLDPTVIEFIITDQKNLKESKFKFIRYINEQEDRDTKILNKSNFKNAIVYDIGALDKRKIELTGFGASEGNGISTWRWGIGKHSKIRFNDLKLEEDLNISISFKVIPFKVNENKIMKIESKFSKEEIILKHGSNNYTVNLTLPEGEKPELNIYYANTASPKSLGLGSDKRELSVLWSEIEIIMLK